LTEVTNAAESRVPSRSSDATRERLRTAAAEVFAERGYEGAGVQEIARRAGLTTGAIYSRYSGKAELLAEAIRDQASPQLDALFATERPEGKVADLLTRAGAHLITREPDPKEGVLLQAFVAARRDPELQALLRDHLARRTEVFHRLIEFAKSHGDVDPEIDTASLAHFCQAIGFGFLLYEAIDAPKPDTGPWKDLIARLIEAMADPAAQDDVNDTADTD
jgi:AcrR family transcriptional regulator